MEEIPFDPLATILKRGFQARVARNPRYSIRAFARDLGLSHSHLLRLMTGRRRLSVGLATRLLRDFS